MERRIITELPTFPASKASEPTKAALGRLAVRIPNDKNIPSDKKEGYLRIIKQLDWAMSKVEPLWPSEIEHVVNNLKASLEQFEVSLKAMGEGSSFFCGSKTNPKELELIYKRILSFEQIFNIIGIYQDKKLKQDLVSNVLSLLNKEGAGTNSKKDNSMPEGQKYQNFTQKAEHNKMEKQLCKNCQLMLSVSLCPNGFIAKKLIKQLPDTEWIAGILYQEGTVVDKDIDKAIIYYEQARKKGNLEAIYRLGSMNERGIYGKPYQYLKMWEQAAKMGHLQALTDLGYLYENGLQDQNGRTLMQPNQDKAFSYYQKASDKKFPRALNNLATFYLNNQKYKNPDKCLKYLQEAAQAQYVKSLHNLGIIYQEGNFVSANPAKARAFIKRSAEKGDIEGRVLYVEMMLNEVHLCTTDDLVELNRYCREVIAKEEDNDCAYYLLGVMCEQGYGVPKSPKLAILYYTISSNYQNQAALLKLGDCYKLGFGVQQDSREAIRCFDKVSKTNPLGFVYLGEIYQKGAHDLKLNYEQAFNYYSKGASQGVPEAYTHLGNMYQTGLHVKRNEEKAKEYFEKAKSLGGKTLRASLKSSIRLGSNADMIQSSYYRQRK